MPVDCVLVFEARTLTPHARKHTHTHTRTHARTHVRTHTHTHTHTLTNTRPHDAHTRTDSDVSTRGPVLLRALERPSSPSAPQNAGYIRKKKKRKKERPSSPSAPMNSGYAVLLFLCVCVVCHDCCWVCSIRQHTSAYASIRQHTSTYVDTMCTV
jgi:hypothetical protein